MYTNLSISDKQFLSGGGEMGALIREKDWSKTSLGNVESWAQSLRTVISVCLNSKFPILLWWGKDMVMIYNDAYRPMLGESKHPGALGAKGKDVWIEIWDIIGPMLNGVLYEGKSTWSENQLLLLNRNGYSEECYFTFSYSPIYDESGSVGGIFCAVTETSEEVISSRHLNTLRELSTSFTERKNELDMFAKTINVIRNNDKDFPFAILYSVGEDGKSLQCVGKSPVNMAQEMVPKVIDLNTENDFWSLREVLVTNKAKLIDQLPEDVDLPAGGWTKAPQAAHVFPITASGNNKPFAVLVVGVNPHHAIADKYKSFFQLFIDQVASEIVNVRNFEEERKRAEALAEIDKSKTVFFSNISHEFRTPLTLMLGPLEDMINKDHNLPAGMKESIELAHRNTMRLLRLVNTLLDFSRIEAGRMNAQYSKTDLPAFTTDLASSFRAIIESSNLNYVVKIEDSFITPAYVDREMWEKIVFNLLSNSYKHTLQGEIALRLWETNGHAFLEVSDTGVGIPEKELPRIFERFHRVTNSKARSFEGSGIGLSLVKELVKLHHGTISAASEMEKGSTFIISIPLGKEHLPPEQIVENSYFKHESVLPSLFINEAMSLTQGNLQEASDQLNNLLKDIEARGNETIKPKILVVDDNADMRNYIQKLLLTDYEVLTANDGKSAFQKTLSVIPDMVISDIMMPVMNGIELTKAIKENKATEKIPVMILSARAGEEARVEGYDIGADDYIVKPFSSKELMARIRSQLRISSLRKNFEAHLVNLFSQAPVAVAIFKGPSFVVEYINAEMIRLWNEPEEIFLNKPILEALPQLQGKGFFELLSDVYHTGNRSVTLEYPVQLNRKDKLELAYINFVFEPLREIEGAISGVMVVANDVTQQVLSRKKIEESERHFKVIIEACPIMMWVSGTDKLCNYFNERWLKFTGRTMEQEIGYGWTENVYPEDLQRCLDIYTTSFDARKEFYLEYRLRRFDGEYRWISDRGLPIYKHDGTFDGYIGGCLDINDRVMAAEILEEKVKQRTAELERKNDELEQFAYVSSHDLQEPLRKIQNFTELVSNNFANEEVAKRFLGKIDASASRLSSLIKSILSYSKISKGLTEFKPIDLNGILEEVKEDFEILIKEKVGSIVSEHLPVINGDALQLHQLFANLISNSLKFSERKPVIKISADHLSEEEKLSLNIEGDYVKLTFEDNGIGFDQRYAEKIFTMFQRLNTREAYQGTGIGLALCKKIVENHNGKIKVSSAPGKGSAFEIYLKK